MIGFVSALASALAVMMIVLSSSLLNLIAVTLSNEEDAKKSAQTNLEITEGDGDQKIEIRSMALGVDDAKKIVLNYRDTPITLICTYGNNLSKRLSMQYAAFNMVVLKKQDDKKRISIEIKEDKSSINMCVVKPTADIAN